ncbi:MAG: NADH-quinone oxidoreductase subunit NuoG [Candidatus Eisenbacteria bacterium]
MSEQLAKIFIEGKPFEVLAGQNLLQAALALGFDLPYFCWHPAFGSIGACRQCAVKQFRDENDTRGRIVMACMTPAVEGARISIKDGEAIAFRAAVLEWLMTNHPHDCPVCDEGGECHLQDMTQMTGHTYRRFRFRKRTFTNQDLGPAVAHEMNRCIQCYRCVRFYRDYAGGRDLQAFSLRNLTYFGRAQDGTLESPFSGNLVEVCPTGVFTDKTLKRHYTRKWDLQTAPSVCVHCGLGCNTIPGERYGILRRIYNRYHPEINGYFLCDRGRFGYEFVNGACVGSEPSAAGDATAQGRGAGIARQERVAAAEALFERAVGMLGDSRGVVGVGSPRASLEANLALQRLVGADRFCNGMGARQAALVEHAIDVLRRGPARIASPRDVERADAVLVLGEDPCGAAPRLELNVRQAALRQAGGRAEKLRIDSWNDIFVRIVSAAEPSRLFLLTPAPTRLDDLARERRRASPEEAARLGYAIARAIDGATSEAQGAIDTAQAFVHAVARELAQAERPVIISGISTGCAELIQAAASIAGALHRRGRSVAISLIVPECNSVGVSLLTARGLDLAREALAAGTADTLIVLENDLFRRIDPSAAEELLSLARQTIVLDCISTATTARAALALPTAPFAQANGTLVNCEGRAQRFHAVYPPPAGVRPAWQWLIGMHARWRGKAPASRDGSPWTMLEGLLAAEFPPLAAMQAAQAPAGEWTVPPIPRQSARHSGRTAILAAEDVHEPKPPADSDGSFAFSMEGYRGDLPAAGVARYWAPGWNSVQALNKFQEEIAGPLRRSVQDARLIAAGAGDVAADPRGPEEPDAPRPPGCWRLIRRVEVFGSEELSDHAPAVRGRRPQPYLALAAEDARALGLAEGEMVLVSAADGAVARSGLAWALPLRILPELAAGVALIPAGYREQPGWEEVDFVRLRRAEGT